MKKVLIGLVAACLATSAWAGMKWADPVVVNTAGRTAQGAIGSARNSTDEVQNISCSVNGWATGTYLYCFAKSADGTTASCYVNSPPESMIEPLRMMSGDVFVSFSWNDAGQCTSIGVGQDSGHEPKH